MNIVKRIVSLQQIGISHFLNKLRKYGGLTVLRLLYARTYPKIGVTIKLVKKDSRVYDKNKLDPQNARSN
jgi:hypothetical protein